MRVKKENDEEAVEEVENEVGIVEVIVEKAEEEAEVVKVVMEKKEV